jgi:hypothetical protein
MKIFELLQNEYYDDDEENDEEPDYSNLPSVKTAEALRPQMAHVAQVIYDRWDEADIDTYAGGGICHFIADEICDVLSHHNINCAPISSSHEQHVYVAAQFSEGVYTIDIHHSNYETGGGFSWKKIHDVEFTPRDIDFYCVSRDPGDFDNYIEDY